MRVRTCRSLDLNEEEDENCKVSMVTTRNDLWSRLFKRAAQFLCVCFVNLGLCREESTLCASQKHRRHNLCLAIENSLAVFKADCAAKLGGGKGEGERIQRNGRKRNNSFFLG